LDFVHFYEHQLTLLREQEPAVPRLGHLLKPSVWMLASCSFWSNRSHQVGNALTEKRGNLANNKVFKQDY